MQRRFWLSSVVIVGGLATMLIGLARGESVKILQKGITLCLQCIGIG